MPYANPDQQREYQRRWMEKRRLDYFKDKACVECGSIEDLEIDHIDASQKISHRIWSWSKERREKELKKCAVRCRPCHVRKSILLGEMHGPSPHGSNRMYEVKGCRCQICKDGQSAKQRKYRARVAQR